MFHRWAALVLVLALCATTPKYAAGQSNKSSRSAGTLKSNYPNPFNPDTKITFSVDCPVGSSEEHVVTMRVLNILGQLTAIPIMYGPSVNSVSTLGTSLNGQALNGLKLPCGDYIGLWKGKLGTTEKEAASGPYIVQLFVDDKLVGSRRIFYKK